MKHKPRIYKSIDGEWIFRWYNVSGMQFITAKSFNDICLRAKLILNA